MFLIVEGGSADNVINLLIVMLRLVHNCKMRLRTVDIVFMLPPPFDLKNFLHL